MATVSKFAPTIMDSGERTEFSTGAVRDMSEGKGRCDLMPLDVISEIFKRRSNLKGEYSVTGTILNYINNFKLTRDIDNIYGAIFAFWSQEQESAVNNGDVFSPHDFILRLAVHYEQGAKKYGENNWQKGIPVSSCMDSAIRHLLKYKAGHVDEPHDVAFVWNLVTALYMLKNKPEMDDFCIQE